MRNPIIQDVDDTSLKPMKALSPSPLLMLISLIAGSAWFPAHAAVGWHDGPIKYLRGCDANYSPPLCQNNGSGYYVSQEWDPSAGFPRAVSGNDGNWFYVKVYMQGIVSGARIVAPYFIPPEGTSLLVNDAAPVKCFYSQRTGGDLQPFGNGYDQIVVDDSVPGGAYAIGGCPKPPYPTANFNGYTGFRIVRHCNYLYAARDCGQNWPMASGAGYEFWIPVFVDRPMDGFNPVYNFTWLVNVLEGFTTNWVQADLPIYASGPSVPPDSADMRAQLKLGTPTGPDRTFVTGQCVNGGPSTANGARCQFSGLPAGAVIECLPLGPVALANGQSISCSADFATPGSRVVVSLQSSSNTTDGISTNNLANLEILPPADLSATLTLAEDEFSVTRVDARCTNNGPSAAANVVCAFTELADQASFGCSTDMPAPSLAAGESIICYAQFPNATSESTVKFQAMSSTADQNPSNNVATRQIAGRASADVDANLLQLAGDAGNTRVQGTCINHGPDRATNATCSFEGLPQGVAATCDPANGTTLAVNQSMVCEAQFPNQATTLNLRLRAGSAILDRQTGNNSDTLEVMPPTSGSADLRTSLVQGQASSTQSRVTGTCTNAGPNAATNVACTFSGLPPQLQAAVTCTPASPQATLNVNASIQCSALFAKPSQPVSITVTATSATPDPTPSNDQGAVQFSPVMWNGFE